MDEHLVDQVASDMGFFEDTLTRVVHEIAEAEDRLAKLHDITPLVSKLGRARRTLVMLAMWRWRLLAIGVVTNLTLWGLGHQGSAQWVLAVGALLLLGTQPRAIGFFRHNPRRYLVIPALIQRGWKARRPRAPGLPHLSGGTNDHYCDIL